MERCRHLAIRLSQPTSTRQPGPSVIEAHNAIVREWGECAFGKFGAHISKGTKHLIDIQISKMQPTYLYVILRQRSDVQAFRARIMNIVSIVSRDDRGQLHFPAYYTERPSSAIVISEELTATKIDNLIVTSSERSLLDAILSSRTPLMLVSLPEDSKVQGADHER